MIEARRTKRICIQERIRAACLETRDYQKMLRIVFPADEFPKAHRVSSNGGPPGCAMAFGRALRQMGGSRTGNKVWLPQYTTVRKGQTTIKL
jgi:hypothetical protein